MSDGAKSGDQGAVVPEAVSPSPSKPATMVQQNGPGYVVRVVAAYWAVSISMVYLNKTLLSNPDASIPAPLFVTQYQCIVTCAICWILGKIGDSKRVAGETSFFTQFPAVRLDLDVSKKVLPLSLLFVGMITFNNLCLQFVEVSFYNVARSLTLVFNVVLSYVFLSQTSSLNVIGTLVVVILGFYLGIDGEVNFSFIGTLSGVCSSLFVAMNSIWTSRALPHVDNDKSKLLWFNNLNASLLFVPLIYTFEMDTIAEHSEKLYSPMFWILMTITGGMGFCIGLVTVMQVKATSPLSHNISGTAKAAFQSILAFYIYGNTATVKGLLGIAFVLGGSLLYAVVKTKEKEAATRAAAAAAPAVQDRV
mmetsp:Transcript_1935/g.6689  ORF Transcript_1935/g.6689 Transcript_1935/m.6689 type:complete len:363 (-) Transcript_1935:57-1145(-)